MSSLPFRNKNLVIALEFWKKKKYCKLVSNILWRLVYLIWYITFHLFFTWLNVYTEYLIGPSGKFDRSSFSKKAWLVMLWNYRFYWFSVTFLLQKKASLDTFKDEFLKEIRLFSKDWRFLLLIILFCVFYAKAIRKISESFEESTHGRTVGFAPLTWWKRTESLMLSWKILWNFLENLLFLCLYQVLRGCRGCRNNWKQF